MEESYDLKIFLEHLPLELRIFWARVANFAELRLVGGYLRDLLDIAMQHSITLDDLINPQQSDKDALANALGQAQLESISGPKGQKLDIDMATPTMAQDLLRQLKALGFKVIPTGIDYGTITVVLDKISVEITTLRHDTQCFGRQAKVSFNADWRSDAERRDFTINALYMDINGRVYDYFCGITALITKKVIFIGSATTRIHEDYLRILRYFRFCARYGLEYYDKESQEAAIKLAPKLQYIAKERIKNELYKLLNQALCGEIFTLWVKNNIFGHLGLNNLQQRLNHKQASTQFLNALPRLSFHDTSYQHQEQNIAEEFMNQAAQRPYKDISLQQGANCRFATILLAAGCDLNEALQDATALKLSHKEKAQISAIYKNMSKIPPQDILTSLDWHLYNLGANSVKELLYINYILFGANFLANPQALKIKLDYTEKRNFPALIVSATDLIAMGLQGPQIGAALDYAKEIWFQYEFKLEKDVLLDKIAEIMH